MICHYYEEPTWLVFASDLPQLLYYSHIPVAILALLVGTFLLVNNPKGKANRLLFLITLTFAGWISINLISWTNIRSEVILTLWPFFGVFSALISILSIYLVYVFSHKEDAPNSLKTTFLLLLLPVFIFAHTDLSVSGFNISDCDAFGFEGFWYSLYYTSLGGIAMLWSAYFLIKKYVSASLDFRKQILLFGFGIEFFLLTFFSIIWLASYLANIGVVQDSDFEFYGLFGMAVFMVFIGVLMAKFKTFQVGIITAQALIVALVLLVGSQFTFNNATTSNILTAITLVLTGVAGIVLNRSVKKEILQREKLEILTDELAHANERLKELDKLKSEFVSIASHQLRSPLTAIRGYASMLAEGSFGKLPEKAQESADRIAESARMMAMSVEDYLNVSRIESGNMKYEYSDFNLKDRVEEVTDELREVAADKNLLLLFRHDLKGRGVVHADVGKTVQICHNLINNSIKYTNKGSVNVFLRDDVGRKKIYVEISDTGVGMSEKTIKTLFQKFSRADDANKTNSSGTGLGLFVANKMAEAMGGDITATSAGEGKGSCFVLELPLSL